MSRTRTLSEITPEEPGYRVRWGKHFDYFPPAATSPFEALRWLPRWFPSTHGVTVRVEKVVDATIGCTRTAGTVYVGRVPYLALPAPKEP